MLSVLDNLPEALLNCDAGELHKHLQGPTLIHLQGRNKSPLFLSVLLHGNEDTGWYAVRGLLGKYRNKKLPRDLSIYIGNVEAAKYNVRYLDQQPDYNRIWRVKKTDQLMPEHKMMQQVTNIMRQRKPFASIDIHNNTGINPHYACVNRLDHHFFHLATLFSRTVVYFTRPDTVQSSVFSEFCPALTVECGQPGQVNGVNHVMDFIDACLHLSQIPDHEVSAHDIDLFHTVAVAKVLPDVSFCFKQEKCDIRFPDDLDHLNFRELPVNTTLGWVNGGTDVPLDVRDEQGREVRDLYFEIKNSELRLRTPIMPSMLTVNERAIRQDCLCYLMERYPVTAAEGAADST